MEYNLLFRRLDERLAEENIDLEIFITHHLTYYSTKINKLTQLFDFLVLKKALFNKESFF